MGNIVWQIGPRLFRTEVTISMSKSLLVHCLSPVSLHSFMKKTLKILKKKRKRDLFIPFSRRGEGLRHTPLHIRLIMTVGKVLVFPRVEFYFG